MADLSITAANVQPIDNSAAVFLVQFGESVTQGQALYKKSSDGKYWKASNDVDDAEAAASAIALTPGSADEFGIILAHGKLNIGATLTVQEIYVLSQTPGGVAPYSDLATGDRLTIVGYASAAGVLEVDFTATTIQAP